jgi:hypothetical protein
MKEHSASIFRVNVQAKQAEKERERETMALELYNEMGRLHFCKLIVTNTSKHIRLLTHACSLAEFVSYSLKHILNTFITLKVVITMVKSGTILHTFELLTSMNDIHASCYNNATLSIKFRD